MARKKKQGGARKGAGRPRGSVVAVRGSGLHPKDLEWKTRGYLVAKEAAELAGLRVNKIYARIDDGRLVEGTDFIRDERVVYISAAAAEEIRKRALDRARATLERLGK